MSSFNAEKCEMWKSQKLEIENWKSPSTMFNNAKIQMRGNICFRIFSFNFVQFLMHGIFTLVVIVVVISELFESGKRTLEKLEKRGEFSIPIFFHNIFQSTSPPSCLLQFRYRRLCRTHSTNLNIMHRFHRKMFTEFPWFALFPFDNRDELFAKG